MSRWINKTAATIAVAGVLSMATVGGASATSGVNAWFPNGSWPVAWGVAGVGSVMGNAAYVQASQCREMTSREALTSLVLPVVGWIFNDNASRCGANKR